MSATSGGIVLIALVTAAIALGLFAFGAAWRRAMRAEASLPFGDMLRRLGIGTADLQAGSTPVQAALAARTCFVCRSAPECRAWLQAGARQGYESFCPNAAFFERLQRRSPEKSSGAAFTA